MTMPLAAPTHDAGQLDARAVRCHVREVAQQRGGVNGCLIRIDAQQPEDDECQSVAVLRGHLSHRYKVLRWYFKIANAIKTMMRMYFMCLNHSVGIVHLCCRYLHTFKKVYKT